MNLSKKLTYIVTFIVIFGLLPYGIYKFYYKYQDGLYSGLAEYSTYTTPDGKYTVSLRDTKQFGNEDEVVLKIYLVDNSAKEAHYIAKKRFNTTSGAKVTYNTDHDDSAYTVEVTFSGSSAELIKIDCLEFKKAK